VLGIPHSFHDLLAFKVSVEKFSVILMGLPLYVIYFFSLTAYNTLFLFSVLVVLERFYFGCMFGVLEASCARMGKYFSRFGKYSDIILMTVLLISLACTYSASLMPMILKFGLLMDSLISCIFLSQILSCLTQFFCFFFNFYFIFEL
jgi:hypothetical protein